MGDWIRTQLGGFISNAINSVTGGSSESTASSSGGAVRRSAAAPAMLTAEAVEDTGPVLFRAARMSGGETLSQAVTRSLSDTESHLRATAAIRRVQRDMDNVEASVAAYYTAPERRGSGNPQPVRSETGFTAAELAAAMREALKGTQVVMDGRTVGRLVAINQGNMGRALGTL